MVGMRDITNAPRAAWEYFTVGEKPPEQTIAEPGRVVLVTSGLTTAFQADKCLDAFLQMAKTIGCSADTHAVIVAMYRLESPEAELMLKAKKLKYQDVHLQHLDLARTKIYETAHWEKLWGTWGSGAGMLLGFVAPKAPELGGKACSYIPRTAPNWLVSVGDHFVNADNQRKYRKQITQFSGSFPQLFHQQSQIAGQTGQGDHQALMGIAQVWLDKNNNVGGEKSEQTQTTQAIYGNATQAIKTSLDVLQQIFNAIRAA